MMEIQIEKATAEDANRLIEVQDKAFLEDVQRYGQSPGYGNTPEKMLMTIENKITFKIIAQEKIVGAMIVISQGNGRYHLSGLCVIPEYENNGIGRQAMEFLASYFKDAVQWSLKTPVDNLKNHSFYEKFGFRISREDDKGKVRLAVLEAEHLKIV